MNHLQNDARIADEFVTLLRSVQEICCGLKITESASTGDFSELNNCRAIAITNVLFKTFESFLAG